MAHSRGRSPRNRSRATQQRERRRRALEVRRGLHFGPADWGVVRAGIEAEAAGDAQTALELHLAGPHVVGSLRESRLRELVQLGEDAPPWVVSRWIVTQVVRRLLVDPTDGLRRAMTTTGDTAFLGVDQLRPMGKDPRQFADEVASCDWVCAQLATYDFGGLEEFLQDAARPGLVERADRIEAWGETEMGGYRLDDVIDDRLLVTDLRDGAGREVLNLGASWDRTPGTFVIGRVVPVSVGPGLMFESRPLAVDEPTALDVVRARGPGRAAWTSALAAARAEERLPLGFSALEPTSFLSDLPYGGWSGLDLGASVDPQVALADTVLDQVTNNPAFAAHLGMLVVPLLIDPEVRARIADRCVAPDRWVAWMLLGEAVQEPARQHCRSLARASVVRRTTSTG